MWALYSGLDYGPRPLEFNVYQVEWHYARTEGVSLEPEAWGWDQKTSPDDMGTWRPGHLSALSGLPSTIRFLLFEPPGYPPLSRRLPAVPAGLAESLGIQVVPLLLLSLLGALAAARAGVSWPRRLLAGLYLLVLGGGTFLGALKLPFAIKFFLPVLLLMPMLVLAGAALPWWLLWPRHRRDWDLPWWPVALLAMGLLVGKGPWSAQAAETRVSDFDPASTHLARFLPLRATLTKDKDQHNVVVDLTKLGQAAALYLYQADILIAQFDGGRPPIVIPASPGVDHRYLVLCFALNPCQEDRWWTQVDLALRRDERFRSLGQGVYEDSQPEAEAILLPDFRP